MLCENIEHNAGEPGLVWSVQCTTMKSVHICRFHANIKFVRFFAQWMWLGCAFTSVKMCLRVLYLLRSPICLLISFVNFLYINTTRDISNECFLSLAKELAWEFRITGLKKCTLQPAEKTPATAHLLTMKPCIYRPCHLLCIVAAHFPSSFLLYNSFFLLFLFSSFSYLHHVSIFRCLSPSIAFMVPICSLLHSYKILWKNFKSH